MARYLVTGGAGFIGSNLVDALLDMGHEVTVLDDLSTGKAENLAHVQGEVRLVEGSILDGAALREAMEGADYVLHHAALVSVAKSVEAPALTQDVNARGSLSVLEAAKAAGVRRVVMASSSAVYGDGPGQPKSEDMLPRPESPYAATKLAMEHWGRLYTTLYGLEVVSLRYFNVFGPRQDPGSDYAAVIPKFVTTMLARGRPTIFGDGGQTRDFCHVDNVVQANLLAAEARGAAGMVFNVGTGVSVDLLTLVREINAVLGTDIHPEFGPQRAGDVRHSAADISLAREVLGYEPRVDLAAGLEATMAWYAKSLDPGGRR